MSDDVHGVLYVTDDKDNRTFTKSEESLLGVLASYAAIALSKAGTLKQLRVLDEMNVRLSAATTLDNILENALVECLNAIGTDEGSIIFVNRETNELEIIHWMVQGQLRKNKPHRRLKIGEGIAGVVADTNEPRNCEDTANDPDFVRSFTGRQLGALLCVPVSSHGRALYVLSADSSNKNFFSKENEHFLSAMAKRLTTTIEAQNLRDVSQLLSSLTVDKMLKEIVKHACVLTGMEASTVFLRDRTSDDIRRQARYPFDTSERIRPRPEGLTTKIFRTGKAAVITNAQEADDVVDSVKKDGVQVIVGVPILIRNQPEPDLAASADSRTIGVLFVNTRHYPESQLDHAVTVLNSLAAYAAMAIENAWLLETEKRRVEMLYSLQKTSLDVTTELRVPELGNLVLSRAVDLLEADGGALYLAEQQETLLKVAAVSNIRDNFRGRVLPIGKSLVGRVIRTGKADSQTDYGNWEHRLEILEDYHLTAVAAAPIQWQGKIYGAIAVHDVREKRTFTPEDLNLLSHLGNLAAVALENALHADDLDKLMNSSQDAIIAVTEEGGITRINDAAKQIIGRENEEMIGENVVPLYYGRGTAGKIKKRLYVNEDGTLNEKGRLTNYLTELMGKDGIRIPIRLSASILLDYDGNPAGSVGFFRDLREERKAEGRIEALKGLLAASRVAASSASLSDALLAICEEVQKSLNADAVTLYKYDQHTGVVTVPPESVAVYHMDIWRDAVRPDSPVKKAIAIKEAQFITDAAGDNSIVKGKFIEREGIKSCATAPLKVGDGRIVGVMFLNYRTRHLFDDVEKDLVRIFARHAAIVVENARLYEATNQQSEKLMAIRQEATLPSLVSSLTAEDASLAAVLNEVANRARHLTDAEYGALAVLDAQGKIEQFITAGMDEETIARIGHNPEGKGVLGLLLHEDATIRTADVTRHASFSSFPLSHPHIKSFLGVSIESRQRIIGSFYVGNKKGAEEFSDDDAADLRRLADLAAIAIENARLYETTQKSLKESRELHLETTEMYEESKALQDACIKLAESVEPRELLNHVMQSVMTARRGSSSGSILLFDPKRDDFTEALRCTEPGKNLEPYQTTVTQDPNDIAYAIVRGAEAVFVSDIRNDERFSQRARDQWHSVAGLPLRGNEGPIGVLYINWPAYHEFGNREQEWLRAWAATASLAVEAFRTRELISASQNINSAITLASRWSKKAVEKEQALSIDLNNLKNKLPSGIFDTILDRMRMNLREPSFSKALPGMGFEAERLDLHSMVRDVTTRLCEKRKRTPYPITPRFEMPKEHCFVLGNSVLVKTAIEILIENAIASITGKQVQGQISIDMSVDSDIARTLVRDNGLGVNPEVLRDSYGTERMPDLGHSYSLAASILKKHKGDIRVVQTNEKGTTIEFWLPVTGIPKWRQSAHHLQQS
jgi:PAS domain S-box-containing protein